MKSPFLKKAQTINYSLSFILDGEVLKRSDVFPDGEYVGCVVSSVDDKDPDPKEAHISKGIKDLIEQGCNHFVRVRYFDAPTQQFHILTEGFKI